MYPSTVATGFLTASLLVSSIICQSCGSGSAQEINGNWYCSEVKAITYKNFPGNGSYNEVIKMDDKTGQCDTVKHEYTGSLAPLNEELSVHTRGPIWLKKLAVYMPGQPAIDKRSLKHSIHGHRHQAHHYHHGRQGQLRDISERELGKRSVGEMVSATIDGQLVSWINEYAGPSAVTSLPSPVAAVPDEVNTSAPDITSKVAEVEKIVTSVSTIMGTEWITPETSTATLVHSPTVGTSPVATSGPVPITGWVRQAYYDADTGNSYGLTFLNHYGGTDGIPGTAAGGPAFGVSLSYASADGKSGAKSPQVLSNGMIDDDVEVVIMSNRSCEDGGCSYVRPGGVHYHGFGGSEKVFLFEFTMPITSKAGFNEDMPAIWLLNAQIPRTSQYGTNPDCSCWTSGCGEFDILEILDSGNFRCKSTLHMDPAGGSSDWFQRPSDGSMTVALIIGGENGVAAIRVLDSEQSFDEHVSKSTVEHWLGKEGSVFKMAN